MMESLKEEEEDLKAVNGANRDFSPQEDTVRRTHRTAERIHVDSLLDVSEESAMKEVEPQEYHCYSGWEEAVWGWARVAPLSCILLTQKGHKKPKHKEADNPTPLFVDPTPSNADSSSSIAEQLCEPEGGLHGLKKLNQQTGFWNPTMVTDQQPDALKWPVLSVIQRNTAHLFHEEKLVEEGTPLQPCHLPVKNSVSENRPMKPQRHSHRPNNTVVPIRNFTFLPPIKSPHLNPKVSGHICRSKKAPGGETYEENCFVLDKKGGSRTTVANSNLHIYPAALTSKHQTCQHNPQFLSAMSVSVPKRYQVPASPKPDTLHRTSYSMSKSLSHAIAQPHMHPSCLFS